MIERNKYTEFLEEEGVSTDGIGIVEGRKTTVKTRLLATRV